MALSVSIIRPQAINTSGPSVPRNGDATLDGHLGGLAEADSHDPLAPERRDTELDMNTVRGQTTIDFAIGISIFLSVLVFVFSFIPGVLQPFVASGQEDPIVADRAADRLSQDMLGTPETPFVLNRTCAVDFFDRTGASSCRFDSGSLTDQLAVETGTNVNVSLEGNVTGSGTVDLCWDTAASGSLDEVGSPACDVDLLVGDNPPPANDVTVTARRVVSLDGETVTMKVVVW
jgi:hypothetical protein